MPQGPNKAETTTGSSSARPDLHTLHRAASDDPGLASSGRSRGIGPGVSVAMYPILQHDASAPAGRAAPIAGNDAAPSNEHVNPTGVPGDVNSIEVSGQLDHDEDHRRRKPVEPDAGSPPIRPDFEALLKARELDHARELADREARANAWEKRYREAVRDRELASALAGRSLVPGAANQLLRLWSPEFEVFEESGVTRVATRDGRSVARAVSDWLSSPENSHFCQSTTRGGTNPPGTNRNQSGSTSATRPKSLGEVIIQQWCEAATAHDAGASSPIGLHRRR